MDEEKLFAGTNRDEEWRWSPRHYALGEPSGLKTKWGWSCDTEYEGKLVGVYAFSLPSLRDKWVALLPVARMKVKAVMHLGFKGHRRHVYEQCHVFMG